MNQDVHCERGAACTKPHYKPPTHDNHLPTINIPIEHRPRTRIAKRHTRIAAIRRGVDALDGAKERAHGAVARAGYHALVHVEQHAVGACGRQRHALACAGLARVARALRRRRVRDVAAWRVDRAVVWRGEVAEVREVRCFVVAWGR